MKTRISIAVLFAVMALPIAPLSAGEPAQKTSNVEERLREIDLDVLFEHYKKVSTALNDMRLEARLSEAEGTQRSDEEIQAENRKIETLSQERQSLRYQIRAIGKEAAKEQEATKK